MAKRLWVVLVVYTVTYGILFDFQSDLLPFLLSGNAPMFATQFFNLMGLVPIYFILDYVRFRQKSFKKSLPFFLGFLGGAYAILIGYWGEKDLPVTTNQKPRWWYQGMIVVLLLVTLLTMMNGILSNTGGDYFQEFFSDSLVGIMTVDFLVLYGWSIVRSKQISTYWWLSFLPMLGFGIVLILGQPRRQP